MTPGHSLSPDTKALIAIALFILVVSFGLCMTGGPNG